MSHFYLVWRAIIACTVLIIIYLVYIITITVIDDVITAPRQHQHNFLEKRQPLLK